MQKQTQLANELWPLLLPRVAALLTGLASNATGGGGVTEHELGGSLHTGTLRDDQAPQFLKLDGSRALIGNLSVSNGVTIDGVDLSAHAADPDAHHARLHDILSEADHGVTGAAWQIVGLPATDTLGLLTPSSDVRSGPAEALLKSDSSGGLGVKGLTVGAAMTLAGTNNIGAAPDIQFASNGLLSAESSLYFSVDSNNSGTGFAFIFGHNAATSGFTELARLTDGSVLRFTGAAPTISTAANDLTIAPASRTLFADDKQMRSQTHTAGFLGAGWSISWPLSGKAHLDIRSGYFEELEVTAFQADVMRVRVAEDFLTQSMGFTAEPFTTPAIGSSVRVYFENNAAIAGQIFIDNEWVLIQVIARGTGLLVKQVWGQVSAYVDEGNDRQSWLWTTRQGPSVYVPKSSLALSFGASGSGYIHHNVLRSANGPWTRYATWSGSDPYTPANRRVHAQAGNLNGLVDIATNRYGFAAGNNLALTPSTNFSGFLADDTAGLRLFNSSIAIYNSAVQTVEITQSGNVRLGSDLSSGSTTTFSFAAGSGALRLGPSGGPSLFWSGTALSLRNSSAADMIILNSGGDSYFAGVMTIGASGEIRQGSGTWASNWTGLRIWRDGDVGRIGGYKSSALQWYADTGGELRAGGGLVAMAADGYNLARYSAEVGALIAGTESRAALAWWDDIDSRSGTPVARMYAGRSSAGTGSIPSLALEVDRGNASANKRASVWLAGSDPGYNNAPSLRLYNVYTILGIPGIYPQRNPATLAESVYYSGNQYFQTHIQRDSAYADVDIGTAGNPFRTLYATNVIATSISGSAMSGQEWEYAGSMLIDAASAANTILTVTNSGAGRADLDVDRNITLGGTVDGVEVSSFKSAYDSHIVDYAGHIGNANAHHAQAHGLDSSDHTGTLSWAKLNKTGSALADLATRPHSALTGIGANDHHDQVHPIVSGNHTVTGSALQIVGLSATDTLALLTPSSNPGSASAILRTTAGALTLAQLTISAAGYLYVDGTLDFGTNTIYEDATYLQVTGSKAVRFVQNIGNANWTVYNAGGADFRGNVSLLGGADLSVAGSGFYAGSQVLFADSSGGNVGILCNPDPQFALDVAGPARAQYFIGPHAIQLKDALLIAHYDGPERGQYGDPNGHMGQVASITGDVVHRLGKFGKAIEVADAYTNLVSNPGFETDTTGWADYSNGTAAGTRTRTDEEAWQGYYCYRFAKTGGATADVWGARLTMSVTNGATYNVSCWVKLAQVTGATSNVARLYSFGGAGVNVNSYTDTVGEWVRLTQNVTANGTSLQVHLLIQNCTAGTVYFDAVQVTQTSAPRPFFGGTRTAGSLSYANLPVNWSKLTVMCWFRAAATASQLGRNIRLFEVRYNDSNRVNLRINDPDNLLAGYAAGGGATAAPTGAVAVTAQAWHHAAIVVDGGTTRIYFDGAEAGTAAFAGVPTGLATAWVGMYNAGERLNGMVDDFAIVNRALTASEIRAVYESNAPVFAESSVWSWRATPRGLVWADDEGLWMKDVSGNPVLGIYGGEAASKSWGGFTLAVGDLVIGRNAAGAAALMWDQSTGKFGWYGEGNATPQVEIGTDGSIRAGAGVVGMGSYGFAVTVDNGASNAILINDNGIVVDEGGARGSAGLTGTGSRINWFNSELFEATEETYLDGTSTSRVMSPLVLRSYSGDAGWVEIAAVGDGYALSQAAKIVLSQGLWVPGYSSNVQWNSTRIIDLQADTVGVSASNLRLAGLSTSAAAVGTYAGKARVNIGGTNVWIPYYAS